MSEHAHPHTGSPEGDPSGAGALIAQRLRDSISVKEQLLAGDSIETLREISEAIISSIRSDGKLILFGNGGSAADATHIAAEFVGRFAFDRDPMPALSLSDNGSSVTAIGNDYSYELTFVRQLSALGRAGDVAIGLSTSGTSPNVLAAMRAARELGIVTVAFTGARGSALADLADIPLVIPSAVTARIQEAYMLCAHIVCELVEQEIFSTDPVAVSAPTA